MAALMFRANTNDANKQVSRLIRYDAEVVVSQFTAVCVKRNSPNLRMSARKVRLTLTACLESNMAPTRLLTLAEYRASHSLFPTLCVFCVIKKLHRQL